MQETTKPNLYIICGLPFSGKTTLIKALAEASPIVPISFDTVWQELASENDLEKDIEKKRILTFESVSKYIQDKIAGLLKEGKSVAYDTLNDTPDQREVLRKLAMDNGANSVIIYVNTSKDLVIKRRELNRTSQERHQVEDDMFMKSLDKFVPPLPTEEFVEYKSDMLIGDLLNKLAGI